MDAVFLKILNMSITASWLILAVVLIRLLLKKAPKWAACILWGLVAIRLICPVSFESVFSLIPSSQTIPANIALQQEPAIASGIPVVNQAVNPIIAEAFTPAPTNSANPLQIVIHVAAIIWSIGIVIMLAYAFISYLKLKKSVSACVPVGERMLACDEVKAPFILGLFRPSIYVPSYMSGKTLDYVICHEKAHLQRRDNLWKPIGFLLLSVYWFNPLCWVSYILLCRDIETACDEKVVRDMDKDDVAEYSQALLDCSFPRKRIAVCPLAFGEVGVKERVKGVLNYKKPAFWIIVVALAACIVIGVCFLTNPKDYGDVSNPFGKNYAVSDIIFESGMYADGCTVEDAPKYCITDKKELLALEDKNSDNWLNAGVFEEIELTDDNFDRYFIGIRGSAAPLRRNTKSAWRLIVSELPESAFYYLLQKDDGEIYLTYGYWVAAEKTGTDNDMTRIRWVFALTEDTESPVENIFSVRRMTLDDVRELAKKGDALSWDDFDAFQGSNIGSGMYIMQYVIDDVFEVIVDGYSRETEPMDIKLHKRDIDAWIDIRAGDVDAFINEYIDSASLDIDNDGVYEDCIMTSGPTYGLFTVVITASVDGRIKYKNTFSLGYGDVSFAEKDGAAYWVRDGEYHRLYVEENRIVLEGLDPEYEWYWGDSEWNYDLK